MLNKIKTQIEPCISLLNKKGYRVLTHDIHLGGIRIVFDKGIKLPNIPEEYHLADNGTSQIITKCYMGIEKDLLDEKIFQYNLQLLNWVLSLPFINNKKRGFGLWEKIKKILNMTH